MHACLFQAVNYSQLPSKFMTCKTIGFEPIEDLMAVYSSDGFSQFNCREKYWYWLVWVRLTHYLDTYGFVWPLFHVVWLIITSTHIRHCSSGLRFELSDPSELTTSLYFRVPVVSSNCLFPHKRLELLSPPSRRHPLPFRRMRDIQNHNL